MNRSSHKKNLNKTLRENSKKLRTAVEILNEEYNKKDLLKILNEKLQPQLKASHFSKLIWADLRSQYLNDINSRNFHKIFEIIIPLLENKFNTEWDDKAKKWVKISKEDIRGDDLLRLQGLIGVWEGYSWDATTTNLKQEGHIHIFKIDANKLDKIICSTERATFVSKKIKLITSDRIGIEMSNSNRKIFLIVHIGNVETQNLKNEKSFRMAYTDSGNTKVKCGLAILERTNKTFEEMDPVSKPLSFFKNKKEAYFIDFLRDTQLIID